MSDIASSAVVPKPSSSKVSKKRSRKRGRDSNAPVQPKNAFTFFMMARRSQLVQERPDLSHIDISKQLGVEWKALSAEERAKYVEQSAAERAKYTEELAAYMKTDAYKQFRRKKRQREVQSRLDVQNLDDDKFDVPIFSQEFLDLNKEREAELRRLRVEVVRLEEEQAALDSNIGRLKKVTEKLDTELQKHSEANNKLLAHLESYRRALVQAFAHMPFPGSNVVPTLNTIDSYMNDIHKLCLETPGEHQDFVAKARDIVTKLRLPTVIW